MAKVFITGAAGFIGFHLAQALSKRGDTVLGYDNFNDYYSPALKRQRAKILRESSIEIIENDLNNKSFLSKSLSDFQPTHCVHLAAQAGVRYSISNPQAYIQSNIEGFLNILEACKENPKMKLVYASSSSVYGLNKEVPFAEHDRTDAQASLYGVTKKANELMASTYHHLFGIPVTGLRFFTVYGPWGRPDMAYYSFTKAILAGDPIKVFNFGKLQRDFTYIDDIVQGIIAAIDLGATYEIFNLGNHKPVKLLDFISILEKILGKEANKNFVDMQAGDVEATYADITHSSDRLQFQPETSIEKGLEKFAEWYLQYHSKHLP